MKSRCISMAKIVIVTGIPGVGKTTILDGVATEKKYKVVTLSSVMLEIAAKKGIKAERDTLRYLPNSSITELGNSAFEHLSEMGGNILLDTHASVEQNGRYVPGLPYDAIRRLSGIAGFVYIDGSTDDIVKRRMIDKSRTREKEERHLIHMQRSVNVSMLSYLSTLFNVPLYVVVNKQEQLEKAIETFRRSIEDAFSDK